MSVCPGKENLGKYFVCETFVFKYSKRTKNYLVGFRQTYATSRPRYQPRAVVASEAPSPRSLSCSLCSRMLPFSALSTAFAGSPPARMHATLPGVKDPSPYTIYSGYLDAGVPPSGRGKMSTQA